jgi:uncharacterized membrane protein
MSANATVGGGQSATPSVEPRWPASVAVLVATALWLSLPSKIFTVSEGMTTLRIAVPVLALALLVPLTVTTPHRHVNESGTRRRISIAVTALVSLMNAAALAFLVRYLLTASHVDGRDLLLAGFEVWWTNVIVFALWYWELDGGGPPARLREPDGDRDFAFVQMTDKEVSRPGWRPRFSDYFYVSFTNSSAFSPTDTLPLSRTAKELMLVQSSLSLVTLLLVAARAVNILS